MNFTPEYIGMLKGAAITAAFFTTGMAVGLFSLHRKHEEALNRMESDTARFCLDMAAEHYEGVILRREKKLRQDLSAKAEQPNPDSDEFQKEMDAMNNYEEPDEEWKAMREEMARQAEKCKALAKEISQKDAECEELLRNLAAKPHGETNLNAKACSDEEGTQAGGD